MGGLAFLLGPSRLEKKDNKTIFEHHDGNTAISLKGSKN
jgi:hypothetical protein